MKTLYLSIIAILVVVFSFNSTFAKNWQARSEKNFNKVLEKITPQVKN